MNCIFTIANERLVDCIRGKQQQRNQFPSVRVQIRKSFDSDLCSVCVCVFGLEVFEITLKKKKSPRPVFLLFLLSPTSACLLFSYLHRISLVPRDVLFLAVTHLKFIAKDQTKEPPPHSQKKKKKKQTNNEKKKFLRDPTIVN